MKKIYWLAVFVVYTIVIAIPSFAIELSIEAVGNKEVPDSYATIKNDDEGKEIIVFGSSTIFGPSMLNTILEAYERR